jgi:hypothetical protein
MANDEKAETRGAGARDEPRLVVKTDYKVLERLNAVMGGRRYKHPHGHLFAGTPVMKNLKNR